jgi:hypothetical protein
MPKKVTVADLVMGAGGLVTFLFSFFAFYSRGGSSASAWDTDAGAFATTVPAILGLVMVAWIGLQLAGVSLPEQVLTYNHAQLKGTWGIAAVGIMLSWISTNDDTGFGFWFMFIGSLAMAVGAVMALLGKGSETIDIPGGNSDSESPAPPPTTPPPPPTTPPAT